MGDNGYQSEWNQLRRISSSVNSLLNQKVQIKSEIGSLRENLSRLVPIIDENGYDISYYERQNLGLKIHTLEDKLNQIEQQQQRMSAEARGLGKKFQNEIIEYRNKQKNHAQAVSSFATLSGKKFGRSMALNAKVGTCKREDYYESHCKELEKLSVAAEMASNGQVISGTPINLSDKGSISFTKQEVSLKRDASQKKENNTNSFAKDGQLSKRKWEGKRKSLSSDTIVNQNIYNSLGKEPVAENGTMNLSAISHAMVYLKDSVFISNISADLALAEAWDTSLASIIQYRRDNNLMWIRGHGFSEYVLIPKTIGNEYGLVDDDLTDISDNCENVYEPNSRVCINGKYYRTDDYGTIHMYRRDDGNYYTLPNVTYTVKNYIYRTDSLGRIIFAEGILRIKEGNKRESLNARVPDMKPGDQRGHIFGDKNDGSNRNDNLIAQLGRINQGAYKTLELELNKLTERHTVMVAKNIYYSDSSLRPSGITVTYSVDGAIPVTCFFGNQEE